MALVRHGAEPHGARAGLFTAALTNERLIYVVVHSVVYVRSSPSVTAARVGVRRQGDIVAADARAGPWIRLANDFVADGPWQRLLRPYGTGEAWMLLEGGAAGLPVERLLEQAPQEELPDFRLAFRLGESQDLASERLQVMRAWRGAAEESTATAESSAPVAAMLRCVGIEARFEPSAGAIVKGSWGTPGWRVFAARAFDEGTVVERCPLVPVDESAVDVRGPRCVAGRHLLQRPAEAPQGVMPLGYGPLYCRAPVGCQQPPLRARWSPDGTALLIVARRRIEAGEELELAADLAAELRRPPPRPRAPKAWLEGDGDEPPPLGVQPEVATAARPSRPPRSAADGADKQELPRDRPARPKPAERAEVAADRPSRPKPADRPSGEARTRAARPKSEKGSEVIGVRQYPGLTAGAVRLGPSGCGVFALEDFRKGAMVDICPALLLDEASVVALGSSGVTFRMPPHGDEVRVAALGFCGSLSQSSDPNVVSRYVPRLGGGGLVLLTAARAVQAGEELFISEEVGRVVQDAVDAGRHGQSA